jgi:hypothetical protein
MADVEIIFPDKVVGIKTFLQTDPTPLTNCCLQPPPPPPLAHTQALGCPWQMWECFSLPTIDLLTDCCAPPPPPPPAALPQQNAGVW